MSDNLHFCCRHCKTWYAQLSEMVACAQSHGVTLGVRRVISGGEWHETELLDRPLERRISSQGEASMGAGDGSWSEMGRGA